MITYDKCVVKRTAKNYYKYSLWIVAGLTLVGLLVMNLMYRPSMLTPLIISAVTSLVLSIAYGVAWRAVALSAPKTITKFYLVAPALRMIIAALVVLGYCLVVRQREQIREFVIIFFIFYFVTLVFDSVFFARLEKIYKKQQ